MAIVRIKGLIELALAALASAVISRLMPEQDPLRGTLILLPFVVAAMSILGRRPGQSREDCKIVGPADQILLLTTG